MVLHVRVFQALLRVDGPGNHVIFVLRTARTRFEVQGTISVGAAAELTVQIIEVQFRIVRLVMRVHRIISRNKRGGVVVHTHHTVASLGEPHLGTRAFSAPHAAREDVVETVDDGLVVVESDKVVVLDYVRVVPCNERRFHHRLAHGWTVEHLVHVVQIGVAGLALVIEPSSSRIGNRLTRGFFCQL